MYVHIYVYPISQILGKEWKDFEELNLPEGEELIPTSRDNKITDSDERADGVSMMIFEIRIVCLRDEGGYGRDDGTMDLTTVQPNPHFGNRVIGLFNVTHAHDSF